MKKKNEAGTPVRTPWKEGRRQKAGTRNRVGRQRDVDRIQEEAGRRCMGSGVGGGYSDPEISSWVAEQMVGEGTVAQLESDGEV